MRIALISQSLPPSSTGQSVTLQRLLADFSPDEYTLLSALKDVAGQVPTLPAPIHHLQLKYQITRGYRYGLSYLRTSVNFWTGVAHRASQIVSIVRREGCDRILACTGDVLDLPAAYLAAHWLRLPFFACIFDYYSEREWADSTVRFWARRVEGRVLRNAQAVIVPNEVLADALWQRYGVRSEVIHNSLDLTPYSGACPTPNNHVVYTGEIYEAHYDAFKALLAAIKALDIRLHVYTTKTEGELAAHGIRGVVCHPPLSPEQIIDVQRRAGILFLPLAFNSPYPELVRCSATTKFGEYLASGRPVLVHAPRDSFVSWYCRQYGCGLVVDRQDAGLLGEAVRKMMGEPCGEMGQKARERARADFCLEKAREKFRAVLSR